MSIDSFSSFATYVERNDDLTSLLHMRCRDEASTSVIGFYKRSNRSVVETSQRDFLRRAASVGLSLRDQGVTPGSHTLVVCTSPEATLLAFLGTVLIGAVPAIVSVRAAFDDRATVASRIEAAASLVSGTPTVLAEGRNGEALVATVDTLPTMVIDPQAIAPLADMARLPQGPVGEISHIQLTSGSTGAGKAVAVTQANVIANVRALQERAEITPYDVFVTWLPLYHDMGLAGQALTALGCDADIHFLSPFDFLADPASWLETISAKRGTISASPTFGYDLVTKRTSDERAASLDLSSWKSAYCGAEPIVASVPRRFFERFASSGFRAEAFTPSYGLAEATLAVTGTRRPEQWRSVTVSRHSLAQIGSIDLEAAEADNSIEVVALGKPVQGLSVSLYDEDNSQITGELTCGEIVVNGTSVAAGWLQDKGKLQPFPPEGLRTGDIGFFEGGELFVVERLKNIVIRNGHNYSAQVMEQHLADILTVGSDQVVVLDQDIAHGTDLTAIVELDKDADQETLRQRVVANADRFEPPLEWLIFAKKGSVPRTTSGKKRHTQLRQLLTSGQFDALSTHAVVPALSDMGVDGLVTDLTDIVAEDQLTVDLPHDESRILALVAGFVRARNMDVPILLASRLQHDLDFDSLGLLELAMATEEEFNVELERETVAELKTVRDLLDAAHASASNGGEKKGGGLAASLDELRARIPQAYTEVDGVRPNREVLIDGRWVTDFASCNYLGLDERPEMFQAVNDLHNEWGLQRWSSRAVATVRPALNLEKRLADLIGVPDTMIFPTITLLHFGVVPLLAGSDGAIIIDSAAHRSMQDASLLAKAKGAELVTFKHGNLDELEEKLQRFPSASRRLVVLDGVYSMSGTTLDLPAYQALAEKYDALLYLDDAHGFGVYGENPSPQVPYGYRGNGTVKHLGCNYDRIIYVGGLAKAYSSPCAFVSCPTPEFRRLFRAASTMIFSQSASIAGLAQTNTGLDLNDAEGEYIRARVYKMTIRLIEGAKALGFYVGSTAVPIVNVIVGDLEAVITATGILWEDGILLTPAVFPAAPLERGGMRFTVTGTNTEAQIDKALESLRKIRVALDAQGVERFVNT